MSEKNENTFNLVISILHGLFYPIFYVWFFIVDTKFLNPIIEEYSLISNYKDLWDLFRIKILFPLIYLIMCCYFAFKIIERGLIKYRIEMKQIKQSYKIDDDFINQTCLNDGKQENKPTTEASQCQMTRAEINKVKAFKKILERKAKEN